MQSDQHRKGSDLSRSFYQEILLPHLPTQHAAALMGEGSEVLGFDTARSADHNWGPRVTILAEEEVLPALRKTIAQILPRTYQGHPLQGYDQSGTVTPSVEVTTLSAWLRQHLKIESPASIPIHRWLSLPQQHLLQFTAGPVFHDATGALSSAREALHWYPTDIWLWMLASQWYRIGTQEPLLHRLLEIGDVVGTEACLAKLIRLAMEMRFLQAQRYWPYDKWFGTAFSQLPHPGQTLDHIRILQGPEAFSLRLRHLRDWLCQLGEAQNSLSIAPAVKPAYADFSVGVQHAIRPYPVLNAGEYQQACVSAIKEPALKGLVCVGAIDQLTQPTDAMINFTNWPVQLSAIYQSLLEPAPHP